MSSSNSAKPAPDAFFTFIYGGVAGSVAKTIIAPFDRVKIHFQVGHPEMRPFAGKLSGVFRAVRKIYHESGFLALYRGHSAMLARIFPYAAINFTSFEQFKKVLANSKNPDGTPNLPPLRRLLAGSMAGAVAVTITYPFDIIRARLAYEIALSSNEKSPHKKLNIFTGGFRSVVKQLASESRHYSAVRFPFVSFYQGFLPTLLGIIPYAGVSFFTFESLKSFYSKNYADSPISPLTRFGFGLLSGAMAQTVAYPFDVLRRRMQICRITDHLHPSHYASGFFRALHSVWTHHGFTRGLFAGLSINYIKVAPASGISFLVYDTLKEKFPLRL